MTAIREIKTLQKASSAAIKTGPGYLYGVVLAGGSDASSVILYDNTAGSGTIVCKLVALTGTSAVALFPYPVPFSTGLYATIAGTGPSVNVYYE